MEQSYEVNTDNAKFQCSTDIVPTATTTTAPVICIDSVSTKDVDSNLGVATDDNNDDDIVLENVSQRLNILIEEVNEEYPFLASPPTCIK